MARSYESAFTDDEWNGILETLRSEVVRAGYGDWDRHAYAALEADTDRTAVRDYLTWFIGALEVGSSRYRKATCQALADLVVDTDGRPIRAGELIDADGSGRDDRRTDPTDDLLSRLTDLRVYFFGQIPEDQGEEGE